MTTPQGATPEPGCCAAARRETDTLRTRNEAAFKTLKDASAWDSSRDYTQEEARRYHCAMVMAISFLNGDLDDYAAAAVSAEEGATGDCHGRCGSEYGNFNCPRCRVGGDGR